jgi:hypothetical protein
VWVFITSLDRHEGVGWVGRRSFWRPQTAFWPYLGMKVFNQPPAFDAAASRIRTRDPLLLSLTLYQLI